MNSIFNYQTLAVSLSKSTRTLYIEFKKEFITLELLFELESILAWSTNKVEIKSIFISCSHPQFSKGYQLNNLQKMTSEKLRTFSNKLQKINYSLQCMPQTIICDLAYGAQNIGVELAIACDIRIAATKTYIEFNHNKLGVIPCSGGISTLCKVVGSAHAKNWIMSGAKIESKALVPSGLIFKSYNNSNRKDIINELLLSIGQQADVARIQTKLGLSENNRDHIEKFNKFENQLANATMVSQDWKSEARSNTMPDESSQEFMPGKHFSTAVKLSLVKNTDS